ncbi:MAG: glutamate racemase [Actinomycetales bacterium]
MRLALIDSGLGMIPTASLLVAAKPTLDLVLCMDPDNAPWGPRPASEVVDRVFDAVRAAQRTGPVDAVVVPCNTASVVALAPLRAELEPQVPVIGTVPAIKPAAARHQAFAVWATAATTASAYQRGLIEEFAPHNDVTAVACHNLAEAIDSGRDDLIDPAVAAAAAATPQRCTAIVLGCTHYPLVAEKIRTALGRREAEVELIDSAPAVTRQTIRRLRGLHRPLAGSARVEVMLSSVPGDLPTAVGAYPMGRRLLRQLAGPGVEPAGHTG